jgi:hypothetical protein
LGTFVNIRIDYDAVGYCKAAIFGIAFYFLADPVCHQLPKRSLFMTTLLYISKSF